jgi:chromosome segregation ATPase
VIARDAAVMERDALLMSLEEVRGQRNDLSRELSDANRDRDDLSGSLSKLQREMDALEARHSCEVAALEAASKALKEESSELAEEVASLREAAAGSSGILEEVAGLRERLKGAEADRKHHNAVCLERDALRRERDAATHQLASVRGERDAANSELVSIRRERDALCVERDAAVVERDALSDEKDAALSQGRARTSELHSLAAKVKNMEENLEVERRKAGSLDAEVMRLVESESSLKRVIDAEVMKLAESEASLKAEQRRVEVLEGEMEKAMGELGVIAEARRKDVGRRAAEREAYASLESELKLAKAEMKRLGAENGRLRSSLDARVGDVRREMEEEIARLRLLTEELPGLKAQVEAANRLLLPKPDLGDGPSRAGGKIAGGEGGLVELERQMKEASERVSGEWDQVAAMEVEKGMILVQIQVISFNQMVWWYTFSMRPFSESTCIHFLTRVGCAGPGKAQGGGRS